MCIDVLLGLEWGFEKTGQYGSIFVADPCHRTVPDQIAIRSTTTGPFKLFVLFFCTDSYSDCSMTCAVQWISCPRLKVIHQNWVLTKNNAKLWSRNEKDQKKWRMEIKTKLVKYTTHRSHLTASNGVLSRTRSFCGKKACRRLTRLFSYGTGQFLESFSVGHMEFLEHAQTRFPFWKSDHSQAVFVVHWICLLLWPSLWLLWSDCPEW